jgi:two-component sensor histidine kinase
MAMVETISNIGSADGDLLKEANHRIANHLALVASMVQTQISALTRGPEMLARADVQVMLRETIGKIVGIGHLHRRLAHQQHCGQIDLGDYLIESCSALITSLSLAGRVSIAQKLATRCSITPEQAQAVGLIVGEIVMNAVKHAHPAGLAAQISLGCSRNADGGITIDIGDDGVGLPEGFDMTRDAGVGFRLIRSLADKLGATLDVESDSLGLCFWLKLPPLAANVVPFQPVAR